MYKNIYLEKEYVSDIDYRKHILKTFNMDSYDDCKIIEQINTLYGILRSDINCNNLMKIASSQFNCGINAPEDDDHSLGLIILHSYDYFYLFNNYLYFKTKDDTNNANIYLNKLNQTLKRR